MFAILLLVCSEGSSSNMALLLDEKVVGCVASGEQSWWLLISCDQLNPRLHSESCCGYFKCFLVLI